MTHPIDKLKEALATTAPTDQAEVREHYWRSSLCGNVDLVAPTDSDWADYAVGDTEPCVHCGDLRCFATLKATLFRTEGT